jgi:hypothetical protein
MKAILVDFASQNQPKWPSFKIFLGGVSRQGSFETASEKILIARGFAPRNFH